jgi:hypothetical protein
VLSVFCGDLLRFSRFGVDDCRLCFLDLWLGLLCVWAFLVRMGVWWGYMSAGVYVGRVVEGDVWFSLVLCGSLGEEDVVVRV